MFDIPYDKYICPDGIKCDIDRCLKECRIPEMFEAERCLSHRTLKAISEQRTWNGCPSATQLLSGTREEYLKIKKKYAIDPQSSVFAIFGTGCHAFLESYLENDKMVAEKRLKDPTGSYSGQFDCYDGGRIVKTKRSGKGGKADVHKGGILYDVKTYGSFKTAHLMGLVKHKDPVLDENGVQKKYKNGRKMYRTYFTVGRRSCFDVAVQLNAYRIMVEHAGYPVGDLQVEVFTRDAGTFAAKDRGVLTNMQLVRINFISDRWIQRFMLAKAKRLKEAVEKDIMPPPCSYRECWGGRKCVDFCAVWQYCDKGRKAHGQAT